jgi:hypothetical protein
LLKSAIKLISINIYPPALVLANIEVITIILVLYYIRVVGNIRGSPLVKELSLILYISNTFSLRVEPFPREVSFPYKVKFPPPLR